MNTPETHMESTPTDETARQREEIHATRQDMGRTLERIEDRVSPARIKERQSEKLRSSFGRVRQSVMGSDNGGSGRISGAASDAREAVEHAPERLEEATRGNPMAAGMIAFGLGALAASMLPTTKPERRVAHQLRDEFEQPVREELQTAGQEVGEHMREHAQHAADEVKETAQDAAERTKDDASSSAERVQRDARDAAQGGTPQPAATRGSEGYGGTGTPSV
jgi:gas vesicle protein